jgi:intracellular sulfur oxidation DsrE/DsrF family protein
MKYFFFILAAALIFNTNADAQKNPHRIVFDMAGSDTADHSAIIRQVNNVLKNSPQTRIEVVFHGKSVYALIKDKTTVKDKIDDLVNNKHVVIAACNNSLNQLKLSKEDVLSTAIIVPVAILELVDKQEKGWSYIKAGH